MGWDELRGLVEHGVEIGSHTVSHPHLPLLSDAEIENELADSRARLEDGLGRPCRFLAYPSVSTTNASGLRPREPATWLLSPSRARPRIRATRMRYPRVDLYRKDTTLSRR